MGAIHCNLNPIGIPHRILEAAAELPRRTAAANGTAAVANCRRKLLAADWIRRYSTAVATVVVLGGFGPSAPAASERTSSPNLSDFPGRFVGDGVPQGRTGARSVVQRWGSEEAGALSPGIELTRGVAGEPVWSGRTMLWGETMTVGLSTTHIRTEGTSGVRMTGFWAFGQGRTSEDVPDDGDHNLFKLFVERMSPWEFSEADRARGGGGHRGAQFNSGVGWASQFAGYDYSINANFSRHYDPTQRTHDDGSLLALGYSTEFGYRRDILYASGYWAEGDFGRLANSSPPPLGPIGLSFAGVGLRGYRPAPWPRLLDSAGFAIGMQTFFAEQAAHWTVELGHRHDLENEDWLENTSGTSLVTRAQFRLAERFMLQMDAFYAIHGHHSSGLQPEEFDEDSAALRVELRVNF